MANAPMFHGYGWHAYSWARGRGLLGRLTNPSVGSIGTTNATVTVGVTPATQAAQHRIVFGTRQGAPERTTPPFAQAEGATAPVVLTGLRPATVYYLRDLATVSAPANAGATGQWGNPQAEYVSAEATFTTL